MTPTEIALVCTLSTVVGSGVVGISAFVIGKNGAVSEDLCMERRGEERRFFTAQFKHIHEKIDILINKAKGGE